MGRKRINQNRSEGVDGNLSERLLADLRGMVWKHVGEKSDFAELAAKANVNKVTISRLMWGNEKYPQTKRPHFETIVRLLAALDRLDLLKAAFAGEHKPVKWGQKVKK